MITQGAMNDESHRYHWRIRRLSGGLGTAFSRRQIIRTVMTKFLGISGSPAAMRTVLDTTY
jgi:hypothetical protein